MQTITWAPGTKPELDKLFHDLRQIQYNDRSHRLWKNYAKEAFDEVSALTIHFNDDGIAEVCSSILKRDCWPADAYRIMNRLWKSANRRGFPRLMSTGIGETAKSQVAWLKANTDCSLYFISRQTDNWEDWMISNMTRFELDFKQGSHKYLTCPNECDDTCWQRIVYNGNEEILASWQQR